MRKLKLTLLGLILAGRVSAQVYTLTMADLQSRLQKGGDTLFVVNFWATWCGPCVAELPHFERVNREFKGVKVLLVSLDFMSERAKVTRFVSAKALKSEVRLLNESNPNDWIDTVDDQWGGSIPATVLYKKGKKLAFHEGDFSYSGLVSFIKKHFP